MNTFRITTFSTACAAFALSLAFAAAPVSFDMASGTLKSASAFAKNGADDGRGDDNGGRGGKGGSGHGGHDDGPNHK